MIDFSKNYYRTRNTGFNWTVAMRLIVQHTATLLLLFLYLPSTVFGQQDFERGTGLEVENHQTIEVVVQELSEDAKAMGLTQQQIRDKIEVRLREAGITPIEGPTDYYLYVNVNVIDRAFSVRFEFKRQVVYTFGSNYFWDVAVTWDRAVTGQLGGRAHFIIENVDQKMDTFVNAYLESNS